MALTDAGAQQVSLTINTDLRPGWFQQNAETLAALGVHVAIDNAVAITLNLDPHELDRVVLALLRAATVQHA